MSKVTCSTFSAGIKSHLQQRCLPCTYTQHSLDRKCHINHHKQYTTLYIARYITSGVIFQIFIAHGISTRYSSLALDQLVPCSSDLQNDPKYLVWFICIWVDSVKIAISPGNNTLLCSQLSITPDKKKCQVL